MMRPGPLLVLCLMALAACDDDSINTRRPDSGVPEEDGGSSGPLELQPGMTFGYQGILTYRGSASGAERNSHYTLTLTIQSVDDRGSGDSTLVFVSTGASVSVDDWDETTDFDSWVARLGPALRSDNVGNDPVTESLTQVPRIPPPPTPPPKVLPRGGSFFLDTRKMEKIRADFAQEYQDRSPQVVEPDRNAGKWLLAFEGADPTIFYYPERSKKREIRLEYNPSGYLMRIDETIGDTSQPPSASCRLTLVSGP